MSGQVESGSRAASITLKPRKMEKATPFSDSNGFRVRFKGYRGTATAGQVTNLDFKFTEELFINGVEIITKNAADGDTVDFQVIDKDGVYAGVLYPANAPLPVVLDAFGESWNVSEDLAAGPYIMDYPARVLANLYIRVVYHSVGGTNVSVGINLFRHKKTT